jgi:hypothetical protein
VLRVSPAVRVPSTCQLRDRVFTEPAKPMSCYAPPAKRPKQKDLELRRVCIYAGNPAQHQTPRNFSEKAKVRPQEEPQVGSGDQRSEWGEHRAARRWA